MRQVQHKARLNEETIQLAPEDMQAQREAILTLWHQVFAPSPSHP
jgi:glutamate-ammonia-ligase adenylyltransferase